MQAKTIELSFNYDNYMESQRSLWSHSFRQTSRRYYIYTILPFLILVVDFSFGSITSYGPTIVMVLILLISISIRWRNLFRHKKIFFRRNQQFAHRFKGELGHCTYIFSDNGIEYIDPEKQHKLKWTLFNPFLVIKDSIFLTCKTDSSLVFTIYKKDVGEKDYLEICEILTDKVGAGKAFN